MLSTKKRNIIIGSLVFATTLFGGLLVASQPVLAASCGGADTAIIDCSGTGEAAIINLLKTVIKILTAGIGIVAVAAVIYGAILYSTSGSSPEGLKKAKDVWMNVVIGLIIFAFLVTITNFIIPGGVFG